MPSLSGSGLIFQRHRYTSLPLISEEEFLALYPEHKEDNPHDLMIARLTNEKNEREKLEKQRKELLTKKQALIAENKKRKDDLVSLDEQLKKFSKGPPHTSVIARCCAFY